MHPLASLLEDFAADGSEPGGAFCLVGSDGPRRLGDHDRGDALSKLAERL